MTSPTFREPNSGRESRGRQVLEAVGFLANPMGYLIANNGRMPTLMSGANLGRGIDRLGQAVAGGVGRVGSAIGGLFDRVGSGGGRTTGAGLLSSEGPGYVLPRWRTGWVGGYTAPGTYQQGWGHYNDGTQHGPPQTTDRAGTGVTRGPRREGAIHNFGQIRNANGSIMGQRGGVNRMLRGDTVNNGRLLGDGIIGGVWRQSGISFNDNQQAL
jgi:hypothetical protein